MQLQHIEFSGQRVIEAYGDMGFRLSSGRHEGSLLILPERVEKFNATTIDEVTLESLADVIKEQENIDILILGTGARQHFPPTSIFKHFVAQRIALEAMDSGAACRTYNILVSEDRKVAAAIIAV